MKTGWTSLFTFCFRPLLLPVKLARRLLVRIAIWLTGGIFRVYYDTLCPVCRRSRTTLEWLDMGDRLEFRDIHDRKQMQRDLPAVSYARAMREMIVQTPRGRVHGGFNAFRAISPALPVLWPLVPLLYLPGVAPVGRRVYHTIARHRYKIMPCEGGVCSLHQQASSGSELSEEIITSQRTSSGSQPNDSPPAQPE